MSDTHNTRRGGRTTWLILALVSILAIVGLVLYLNNNGRDDSAAAAGSASEASSGADADGAERATQEAATDTGQALDDAGANIAEGTRDAAAAAGSAAERVGGAIAEGARDAAQATETAVERSTDGNPDSDNNETNR
ncbi:MAG: hypothetical protein KY446_12000 [Proteobacteria bacterium]|nr:hypothetical protein [Pseudomonadota bacterium]